MFRSIILSFLCLIAYQATSQVTFQVTETPENTPEDATIYISGNFEGWSGGSSDYALSRDGGDHFITLGQSQGTIQFKFTLGSWESVEKGPNGKELGNRTYTFGGNGDTILMQIATWASITGSGGSTAAENVSILDESFYMPQLDRNRRIWIYLPPNYEESDEHYPVLYAHDGQNCFDATTAFAGEWEMDETLNRLAEEEDFNLIVVAIDNGQGRRFDEYSPWINPQYGGGEGAAYIDFIIETLKPHIDSTFRTMPEAEHTALMGSSMGGLISHYGALAHPDVFGKSGVLSPAFWVVNDSTYTFGYENGNTDDVRMYFLAGELESGDVAADAQLMLDTMTAGGFPIENAVVVVDPQGAHNEAFWRRKFGEAVKWLFLGDAVSTIGLTEATIELISKVYPNPALDHVVIEFADTTATYHLRLIDPMGRLVEDRSARAETTLNVSDLGPGLYSIEVSDGKVSTVKKLLLH